LLTLEGSRPLAGKLWTDSGEVHDDRGLKHRAADETREVPVPPELVSILREHVAVFGVADDGRLFRSGRGNIVSASSYDRVWHLARPLALRPDQVDSPMAARPYDLRHAAVSRWLNAGVPATEVAERAGHSVDVLLKVYAKCIDGQRDVINRRIEDALAELPDRRTLPGSSAVGDPFAVPGLTCGNAPRSIARILVGHRQTAAFGGS
jgi:integrase